MKSLIRKLSVSVFDYVKTYIRIGNNRLMAYVKPISVSTSLIAISLVLALSTTLALIPINKAYAITPPDSCFNFNAGTNTITDYYDNENNNPSDPACPKAVDIPSTIGGVTVNVIGDSSFRSKDLTRVTIPSSVTTIGGHVFYHNKISAVIIDGIITNSGNAVFADNPLESFTYNNTTHEFTDPISNDCFVVEPTQGIVVGLWFADIQHLNSGGQACLNRNLAIPPGVDGITVNTIDNSAFIGMGQASNQSSRIESVIIPNSVNFIDNMAFSANNLENVAIGSGVTNIGDMIFSFQSKSGGSSIIDWEESGGDPDTAQSWLDSVIATNIYIDPTQASNLGLVDEVLDEIIFGDDINSDGDQTDIISATLINPSRAVVKYQDESGTDLLPSSTITGYDSGSSTTLTNYLIKDNLSKDINAYYKVGDTVDLPSAPSIPGYSLVSTPPSTLTLSTTGANEIVYTYQETGSSNESSNNSIPNAEDSKTVVIDLPSSTTLSNFTSVKESALDTKDSGYDYPLGLVDFSFSTTSADNTVSLLFVTDLKPNQVIARKYNPNTHGYTTLTNATITETTHNNQHALLLTYTITDNGDLDLDNTSGIIKDPVGLATLAVGSPNTGL